MHVDQNVFPLLNTINSPADVRKLKKKNLPQLAQELREFLCQGINQCGGHFAANLGTIELTIALHYVFNTPFDRIIWDVGHQAYPHKILTGRKERLHTIRQAEGLAAFPSREESTYDHFGVGHSSTSIGAALGMQQAQHLQNLSHKAIAVIGDGALTAGMAFEALNHAGDLHADMIVILNDNDMSISPNVGGLSKYLTRILSGKTFYQMRESSKRVLKKLPPVWELAKRAEEHVKGMLVPGTLFEELGFNYIGPIDGHDLDLLIETLENIKQQTGPKFLHIVTKKGKGYLPAEADPIAYHAVKAGFYTQTQTPPLATTLVPKLSYSQVFGQWICDMAEQDTRLVAITPAMREGSDLVEFSQRFPNRYYDVAIAEQHSVTFAAGLACEGLKPVVAIYSTFLQRAYDQLIHDVALQKLPVLFAIDRAGLVGGDGPTHAGSFDLSFLRCIPNLTIMAPADENECRQMLYTGFLLDSPCAVRYPRGTGPQAPIQQTMTALPIGKAEIKRQGQNLAILAFGVMLTPALAAGEELNATVINMRFVKPLDQTLLKEISVSHSMIVTVEENTIQGGAGSGVNEYLLTQAFRGRILNLGLPDVFLGHGDPQTMLREIGLDKKGIVAAVQQLINK